MRNVITMIPTMKISQPMRTSRVYRRPYTRTNFPRRFTMFL